MDAADLDRRFTYHKPRSEQDIRRYEKIRDTAHMFALDLDDMCPDSRELSLAITHLEDAVMWANAAIARHA